jgi:hypothetical protein
MQPAVETALGGHERKEAEGFDPLEGFAHIACELLASNDGDGEDFTVGGFRLPEETKTIIAGPGL